MSDNIQHIDVDSDEYLDAPRALREYVKKLQAQNDEVIKERDSYKSRAVSSSLGDVLGGFRNPERVKRDLLADKIDPLDSEAVNKWLADNGDDYAKGEGAVTQPAADPAVEADAAAMERIQSTPLSSPADMSALEAAMQEVPANASGADLIAAFKQHGL